MDEMGSTSADAGVGGAAGLLFMLAPAKPELALLRREQGIGKRSNGNWRWIWDDWIRPVLIWRGNWRNATSGCRRWDLRLQQAMTQLLQQERECAELRTASTSSSTLPRQYQQLAQSREQL